MFMFAIVANTLYGLGIIVRAYSWGVLLDSAPWIMGSLGTVGLDAIIFFQVLPPKALLFPSDAASSMRRCSSSFLPQIEQVHWHYSSRLRSSLSGIQDTSCLQVLRAIADFCMLVAVMHACICSAARQMPYSV